MLRPVLLCALFALACSQTTDVVQCIRYQGADLPINVFISGCPSPQPICTLIQGQDAVVDIIFRAPRNIRSMTTLANAFLGASWIFPPIPYALGENAVTCNFLKNSYCPIMKDEIIMYQLRMPILDSFPASSTNIFIEFRIEDENNLPVMCLRATIRIGAPSSLQLTSNNTITVD